EDRVVSMWVSEILTESRFAGDEFIELRNKVVEPRDQEVNHIDDREGERSEYATAQSDERFSDIPWCVAPCKACDHRTYTRKSALQCIYRIESDAKRDRPLE